MKHLYKLSVKNIVISLLIGVFFAASLTDIAYPIGPSDACRLVYKDGVSSIAYEDAAGNPLPGDPRACSGAAYEDAISHPKDLLNNEQDSLVRFFKTFTVVSLVSLAALHAFTFIRKKH